MVLSSIEQNYPWLPKFYPWRSDTTEMRWNILVMCKLLLVILILNGFIWKIGDPYIPHLSFLDMFQDFPGTYKTAMRVAFAIPAGFLLINYKPRLMCLILGIAIILILLASKSIFRNHIFICACVFLMSSIYKKGDIPRLIFIQLGIVYIGAAVNKLFHVDWWNGLYMHNWMGILMENKPYLLIFNKTENLVFAQALSWFSMFLEVVIGIFLFTKRFRNTAVYLIVFFHLVLFTVTMQRFGHFFDDIVIILIAFVTKESVPMQVYAKGGWYSLSIWIKKLFDWNQKITIKNTNSESSEAGLLVSTDTHEYRNLGAVTHLLFSSGGFFIIFFFLDYFLQLFVGHPVEHYILSVVYWGMLIVFVLGKQSIKESSYSFQS